MPAFPGLTDVERCADWDVGMDLDPEALDDPANEAYWNAHGVTCYSDGPNWTGQMFYTFPAV